ncbi:MAG: YggS family pyridoxal phosphate-dependent enzyme [Alkalispirochaetaceae bacterium]
MSQMAERIAEVRDAIAESARQSGRRPEEIELMGVSKNHDRGAVEEAIRGGLTLFGENRVQEGEQKFRDLPGAWELHLIGHLQRNKAKRVPGVFSGVHSIDATRTVEALESAAAAAGCRLDVLVEVNISGEQQKYGVPDRDALEELLDSLEGAPSLRCRGLMGIAPWVGEEARIRRSFSYLRELYEETKRSRSLPFDILSMGMSGDFRLAVAEGSTMVRIGTAIFGSRGY